jgi:hypothetical protein
LFFFPWAINNYNNTQEEGFGEKRIHKKKIECQGQFLNVKKKLTEWGNFILMKKNLIGSGNLK